jgi:serine/threonine-protein kinase
VHRDVSPTNVLLSFEGEVKLCDFGIARAYGRAGEMGVGENEASGESTGELGGRVVGKSAYMSPEHARGESLDARADVFAAGILLWEMCAGRRLYKGTEAEMLDRAMRAEIPRLPQRGLAGHDTLQDLLDRALAPERVARFPSAHAMLEALDDYLAESRIVPSQLRFAAFLTDHFGEQVIAERRARELAAKEHVSQPPSQAPESQAQARHPEIDAGFHEAMTVVRGPPPVSARSGSGDAPSHPAASSPTASVPAAATNQAAGTAAPAPARPPPGDLQEVSTAHLGVAAVVLMVVAALLGALLFYLVAR